MVERNSDRPFGRDALLGVMALAVSMGTGIAIGYRGRPACDSCCEENVATGGGVSSDAEVSQKDSFDCEEARDEVRGLLAIWRVNYFPECGDLVGGFNPSLDEYCIDLADDYHQSASVLLSAMRSYSCEDGLVEESLSNLAYGLYGDTYYQSDGMTILPYGPLIVDFEYPDYGRSALLDRLKANEVQ